MSENTRKGEVIISLGDDSVGGSDVCSGGVGSGGGSKVVITDDGLYYTPEQYEMIIRLDRIEQKLDTLTRKNNQHGN